MYSARLVVRKALTLVRKATESSFTVFFCDHCPIQVHSFFFSEGTAGTACIILHQELQKTLVVRFDPFMPTGQLLLDPRGMEESENISSKDQAGGIPLEARAVT